MDERVPSTELLVFSTSLEAERLKGEDGGGGLEVESELELDSGLSELPLAIFAKSSRKSSSSEFCSGESRSGLDDVLLSEDEGTSFCFLILIVLEHISPSSKISHDGFQISAVSPSFSRCLQCSKSRNTSAF